jgi:hypothetical protein
MFEPCYKPRIPGQCSAVNILYPDAFNIRYFRSDAIPAMANAMLGQALSFLARFAAGNGR